MNGNVIEGQRFGRLVADCYFYTGNNGAAFWMCTCDCGDDDVVVRASNLKSGTVKSCGCFHAAKMQERRKPNNRSEITQVLGAYKRSAKRRGHAWGLTREDFEKFLIQDCFYCGSEPLSSSSNKSTIEPLLYNGIDRMNNTKGYTADNTVPCCKICNRAKLDMPYKEFINWIERIKSVNAN